MGVILYNVMNSYYVFSFLYVLRKKFFKKLVDCNSVLKFPSIILFWEISKHLGLRGMKNRYCGIPIRNNNKNGRNFDNIFRKPNLIKILSVVTAMKYADKWAGPSFPTCVHFALFVRTVHPQPLYFSLHFTGTIHLLLHTNSIHGLKSEALPIRPSVFALRYAAPLLHLFSFTPSNHKHPWGNDLVSW
jgi:hypothetical protein